MPEMRIRGGVEYDPQTTRWQPIVQIWTDHEGLGQPTEAYQWHETYASEAEALEAYRVQVRPALEVMLAEIRRTPGARAYINLWGFEAPGT